MYRQPSSGRHFGPCNAAVNTMKALTLVYCYALAASVGLSSPAVADCTYPQAPSSVPDGSTANKDEMVSAMQQFKQYNANANTYLACLEQEMNAKLQDTALPPAVLMEHKALHARKHNAALAELETKAGQFNEQVRIFKARAP
jgi:membrane-anchored protein YejM (alkaline phosphatase superfamily)